jgi:hypothetical protein
MRCEPAPEAVIAFAMAYEADVIQALVAAGWLNDLDDTQAAIVRSLSSVKLTAELHRRAQVYARGRSNGI